MFGHPITLGKEKVIKTILPICIANGTWIHSRSHLPLHDLENGRHIASSETNPNWFSSILVVLLDSSM